MRSQRAERIIELLVVVDGLTAKEAEHRANLMAAALGKRANVLNVIVADVRSDDDVFPEDPDA